AQVSLRSVYVHFDDLEDLYCVVATRQFARIAPMLDPVPTDGSVHERAEALVRRRIRLYSHFGAVGRATQRQAPFSPTLGRIPRDARERSRREVERVFAKELAALDERRRASVLAILDVLTSGRSWETLHDTHALNIDDAVASLVDTIAAELTRTT